MRNGLIILFSAVTLGGWLPSLWAQPAAPDPQAVVAQQQKSLQYLRIEYERCRTDVVDIWTRNDTAEKRARELEEELRKAQEELTTLRSKNRENAQN